VSHRKADQNRSNRYRHRAGRDRQSRFGRELGISSDRAF
jgi:hypothetical protein